MKPYIVIALVITLVTCGSPQDQTTARAQTTPSAPGNLDQLLAPIALYPDSLLAQILMSAMDPANVTALDAFLVKNRTIKGTALQDAAVKAGFEPSFVALALFPTVVASMAAAIDRTTLVGQAFAADRNQVFSAIQRLRHQAQAVGTLKTNDQQEVTTQTTSGGENVIVIEPANPQVIYVPQYNPQVVYTQAPATTTTVVVQDNSSADAAVAAGLIGFTAGIAIGAAVNNNYYYGPYGMYGGRAYMYNDAWDDYYDHREDAREDWMDHREDMMENRNENLENRSEQRSDRAQNAQEQRTDRQGNRTENRSGAQAQGTQRSAGTASANTRSTTSQAGQSARTGSAQSRGYSSGSASRPSTQSATSSDAFSGYSSGASQRSSSARGQQSRSSGSRSGGGGGSRSGGGGRRR